MSRAVLLAAVILVGVGVAFTSTGANPETAPRLLLAGILCVVLALLLSEPPRRRR